MSDDVIPLDSNEFRLNPLFGREWGDFTGFYAGIAVCTVLGVAIILLNVICCCCSQHRHYWRNPDTGNRFLLPIYIRGPNKQTPLDLSELLTAKADTSYRPLRSSASFASTD